MSYLVLARKLRPQTFHDIIGQEHIWKTLISAIKTERVAHAFLFTGPRGTGKTSCARVLTKALNCLSPIDNEPCNQCENCLEINKGNATDVLEIDAASNRGIEHIRELREGVKFSPAKCRYKTYIIDEVHMLTTESFNALLKTLEEPPAHVKFILATTDHHKVPVTVISRCQRYDFTNISIPVMVQYLKKVAASESLDITESALMLIANHSAGGMRDALTTMDMLIGYSGSQIQDDDVVEILGLNNSKEVDDLLYFIVEKDLSNALNHFHSLTAKGRSLTQLITDLLRAVKDLSLVKSLAQDQIHWHQFLPSQYEKYKYLANLITPATLQQYFQILLDVENQIKRSSQAKICTEMGIIKLCGIESIAGVAEVLTLLKEHSSQPKKKGLNLSIPLNSPDFNQQKSESQEKPIVQKKDSPNTEIIASVVPDILNIEKKQADTTILSELLNDKKVLISNENTQEISVPNLETTQQKDQSSPALESIDGEKNNKEVGFNNETEHTGEEVLNVTKKVTVDEKSIDKTETKDREPEPNIGNDKLKQNDNTGDVGSEKKIIHTPALQSEQIANKVIEKNSDQETSVKNNETNPLATEENIVIKEPDIEEQIPERSTEEIKPGKSGNSESTKIVNALEVEEDSTLIESSSKKDPDKLKIEQADENLASESEISSDDPERVIADQWRLFVENVGESANKSLLSLLRNSVILELTSEKLVIGYQNIQIFSQEKKKSIADVARKFFNSNIKVYYKEQDNGIAASIKVQKDEAIESQRNALKAKAAKNPKVLKTLEVFSGSEIKNIIILEESKDD